MCAGEVFYDVLDQKIWTGSDGAIVLDQKIWTESEDLDDDFQM